MLDLEGLGLLFLSLLAGLVYSGILYYREDSGVFTPLALGFLFVFRLLAAALLVYILLAPFYERTQRETEDPLLIVVQDHSESVSLFPSPSMDIREYLESKDKFLNEAGKRFSVSQYYFGERFRLVSEQAVFNDQISDLGSVFASIDALYSNRNIGAVVIASDGIVNRGANPLSFAERLNYPVYTIALGDTAVKRDILIAGIDHNRIAYKGNQFQVEIHIRATGFQGSGSRLLLSREGEMIYDTIIAFTRGNHAETISVVLDADRDGVMRYRADLVAIEGEVNTRNNTRDFFVEVIDGSNKVLLLYQSPHPDVGALASALEGSGNTELDKMPLKEFRGSLNAYHLLVLHQPYQAGGNIDNLLSQIRSSGIPLLIMAGALTDFTLLNSLPSGFMIEPQLSSFNEARPGIGDGFGLFVVPQHIKSMMDAWPPLYTPFATHRHSGQPQVFAYQRIGRVMSRDPLIAFNRVDGRKTGLISGEGIWRWRLTAFQQSGSHKDFDDLMASMVHYLSVKEDKNLLRIGHQQFYYDNESIILSAELYNPSFELINGPLVKLVITNENGLEYPYVFSRTAQAYSLNAGTLPPGDYFFEASTFSGGEEHTSGGRFAIVPLNLESLESRADHRLLLQLAEVSGGELFYHDQWGLLLDALSNRPDVSPVLVVYRKYVEIIDFRLLFFLVLLLLSVEWFIRKRSGLY